MPNCIYKRVGFGSFNCAYGKLLHRCTKTGSFRKLFQLKRMFVHSTPSVFYQWFAQNVAYFFAMVGSINRKTFGTIIILLVKNTVCSSGRNPGFANIAIFDYCGSCCWWWHLFVILEKRINQEPHRALINLHGCEWDHIPPWIGVVFTPIIS